MKPVPVFCFPFAAGSSFSYQPFLAHAPVTIRLQPLDLPGRGRRFSEPKLTSLTGMADDLMARYAHRFVEPYAFYGHSMGSLLAWLLTHRLMEAGMPLPQHLFLSGRGGPSVAEKERDVYKLPTDELVVKIKKIGWQVDAVLTNKPAFAAYEPIIRADLEALGNFPYDTHERPKIDVPATVLIGQQDLYTWEEALAWQSEFSQPIQTIDYPGHHFFIFEHAASVMQVVGQTVAVRNADTVSEAVR